MKKQATSIRQIVPTGIEGDIFFSLEESAKEIISFNANGSILQTIGTLKRNIYDKSPQILACSYDTQLDILGFVATDRQFYLYETQKRQGILKVVNLRDNISYGVWFLPNSSLWVTVSNNHQATVWSITRKAICTVTVSLSLPENFHFSGPL